MTGPRETKDWIQTYLKYTENSEPPRSYHLWVAISTIAAVLQRKCWLEWGPITWFPNLYVVLVGPSGARKGTAMDIGAKFLRKLGVRLAAEAITREALIRELQECGVFTPMSSGEMIAHSSLTIYSQELTVFLRGDYEVLMSDLTDWFDCRDRWTYRTKTMGTDEIVNVWVNLIGATTPDLIQSTLPRNAIGGGLASRIIFVYESRKGKSIAIPHMTEDQRSLFDVLYRDLERISLMNGRFKVTEGFLEAWINWYEHQDTHPPFEDRNFDGYLQRRAMHLMKLCMILSVSEGDAMTFTAQILQRALDILLDAEKNMRRTFSGLGRGKTSHILEGVMRVVGFEKKVTRSRLLSLYAPDLDSPRQLDDVLSTLVQIGYCRIVNNGKSEVIHHIPPEERNGMA